MIRGSFVTAHGTIHGAPTYTNLPSGTPVLYFYAQVKNPSGWLTTLRAVDYGDSAQELTRILTDGVDVFLEGRFQSRLHRDRQITELVIDQATPLPMAGAMQLGRYGARATLLGKIVEPPTAEAFDRVTGVRFTVETENPEGRGYAARIAVANYGYLAEQYQVSLITGHRLLLHGEVRTIRLPGTNGAQGPLLDLRVVTEDVEVLGHDSH